MTSWVMTGEKGLSPVTVFNIKQQKNKNIEQTPPQSKI